MRPESELGGFLLWLVLAIVAAYVLLLAVMTVISV